MKFHPILRNPRYVAARQADVEPQIRTRIYAGFVVVLLLLVTLATVGYFSLGGVSGTFARYATISDNTVRMTEIDRDIVGLRASMREYVRSGSPTSLKSKQDVGKEARGSRDSERHRPDLSSGKPSRF